MVSEVLTDGARTGGYFVSESANTYRSRDQGLLVSGNSLDAGTVLGRITANGKYTAFTIGANDGSQNAVAVLYDTVSAVGGDQRVTVSTRDAELNGHELIWPAGITDAQKITAEASLRGVGLIVRY